MFAWSARMETTFGRKSTVYHGRGGVPRPGSAMPISTATAAGRYAIERAIQACSVSPPAGCWPYQTSNASQVEQRQCHPPGELDAGAAETRKSRQQRRAAEGKRVEGEEQRPVGRRRGALHAGLPLPYSSMPPAVSSAAPNPPTANSARQRGSVSARKTPASPEDGSSEGSVIAPRAAGGAWKRCPFQTRTRTPRPCRCRYSLGYEYVNEYAYGHELARRGAWSWCTPSRSSTSGRAGSRAPG